MYVLLLLVFDFVFLNSFEMRLEGLDMRFETFHAAVFCVVKVFVVLTANW